MITSPKEGVVNAQVRLVHVRRSYAARSLETWGGNKAGKDAKWRVGQNATEIKRNRDGLEGRMRVKLVSVEWRS